MRAVRWLVETDTGALVRLDGPVKTAQKASTIAQISPVWTEELVWMVSEIMSEYFNF